MGEIKVFCCRGIGVRVDVLKDFLEGKLGEVLQLIRGSDQNDRVGVLKRGCALVCFDAYGKKEGWVHHGLCWNISKP